VSGDARYEQRSVEVMKLLLQVV